MSIVLDHLLFPFEVRHNYQHIKENFFALDFETTGLDPDNDKVVEICAVHFKNGKIVEKYNTLVNPGVNIPVDASIIHNITDDMVVDAPNELEAFQNLCNFLGDAVNGNGYICAHNSSFDIAFLKTAMLDFGISINVLHIDTLGLSEELVHDIYNHKLKTMAEYFNINSYSSHRAFNDAEVVGNLLLCLFDKFFSNVNHVNNYLSINNCRAYHISKETEILNNARNCIDLKLYNDAVKFYRRIPIQSQNVLEAMFSIAFCKILLKKKMNIQLDCNEFYNSVDMVFDLLPESKLSLADKNSLYVYIVQCIRIFLEEAEIKAHDMYLSNNEKYYILVEKIDRLERQIEKTVDLDLVHKRYEKLEKLEHEKDVLFENVFDFSYDKYIYKIVFRVCEFIVYTGYFDLEICYHDLLFMIEKSLVFFGDSSKSPCSYILKQIKHALILCYNNGNSSVV